MRARLALAQTLQELGQDEQALDHYRELIRLNQNDNQGVRYLLVPALLEQGQGSDEADRLLGEYDGDSQAMWPYARALRTFQVEGDDERSRAALRRALRVNPHVLRYLLDPGAISPDAPPRFALGSREEGAYVAESLEGAFAATPGALSWLQTVASRLGKGHGGRRRRRVKRSPRH
jgi:tetratricopeptide (TPR) repeat protein